MLFNSFSYPLFLALCCTLYWSAPRQWRAMVLLCAGIAFYALAAPAALLLIGGLAIMTYASGQLIMRKGSVRLAIGYPLTIILLAFVFFKYSTFLIGSFATLTSSSIGIPAIVLPLGMSFFTFEFIHYLVDIHRGRIGQHGLKDFLLFAFFFPTMISGPIKRFQAFHTSLEDRDFHPSMAWTGLLLLLLGYAQKYLFADPLIPFTKDLAHPQVLLTHVSALGGLFLYSWRIYFDFAGLSNIAIGSALLLGFLVPRNFRLPYFSSNIQTFWRYWHMSLSSWVRDYIYISFGGNRVGKIRMTANLLLAMIIVGLWHGAGWNFAFWGLYHGLGLVGHRLWTAVRPKVSWYDCLFMRIVGTCLTFTFVTVGWAFFVTTSLADSFLLLHKAFPIF